MTTRQIAYRLKAEGKTELRRDQQEVAQGFKETYAAAEQGAAQATAAAVRLEKRYRAMAQAAKDSAQAQASQSRYNALLDVREPVRGTAAASAAVFMQDDTDVRRVEALRAALNPAADAQNKLNHELREYQLLANAGKITTAELAQLQGQAKVRFDETTAAILRNERGLTRLAVASRLNLTRQASDVFVTAAMGMNPAMIAIQQGPQILDALATSGIKASGSLIALAGATTLLVGTTAALAAAWMSGEAASVNLEKATTGLGRTSGITATELERLAEQGAEAGDLSDAAARKMAIAYVSTGKIGREILPDLIALTKDYASVFGLDAVDATAALAKAMAAPDVAARDLTRQMGLLDQKMLDHIDSLVKLGDRQAAQALLMAGLQNAMADHAKQAGEIASAWDWAGRAVSNYWDRLGKALFTTPDERLAKLDELIVKEQAILTRTGREPSSRLTSLQAQRNELIREGYAGRQGSASAAANQRAQEDRDRQTANARNTRNSGVGVSAASEAERERREAQQRQRREEDRRSFLDIEVARARQDFAEMQRLEDANAVRTRERQLIDDGTDAVKARTTALEEQQRLIDAQAEVREREVRQIIEGVELEASRIDGLNRFVTKKEREAEIEARILAYRQKQKDVVTATAMALSDQAVIDQARATAEERRAAVREREWKMTLASASGDRNALRGLERSDWIERRAREIEGDRLKPMNFGEGRDQAIAEYGQLMRAETLGSMRDGLRGLIGDIRRGGIREALANQFDNAADRLLNKLIDGFLDFDFSGGSGKGIGNWISKGVDFLFGRNAEGTDFWTGGPTWVGERGPELLDLPRGSRVIESARSMDMVRRATTGGGQPIVVKAVYAPSHTINGVDTERLEGLLAQDRAEFEGRTIATVNDAIARRQIAS